MFLWKYFNPRHWVLLMRRSLLRERLALLIWQCLPIEQQQQDNAQLLRTIAQLVDAVQQSAEQPYPAQQNPNTLIESNDDAGKLVSICATNERYDAIVQISCALHIAHQQCLSLASDDVTVQEHIRQIWGQVASNKLEPTSLTAQLKIVRSLRSEFLKIRMSTRGFSLDKVGGLLPIFSGFFLLSGYVYTRLLLNPFGIDISRFFGLSDYLSASLVGIEPMILALGATFAGLFFYASNTRLAHLNRLIGARRYMDVLALAALLVALILVYLNRQAPVETRIIYWYLLAILLATTVPNLYSMKFKQPVKAYFMMTYTPLFFFVLAFLATHKRIQFDDPERFRLDYLVTQDGVSTEYQMLAGNSLYLFLRDKDKQVTILPVEAIEHIRLLPTKAQTLKAKETPAPLAEPMEPKPNPASPDYKQ